MKEIKLMFVLLTIFTLVQLGIEASRMHIQDSFRSHNHDSSSSSRIPKTSPVKRHSSHPSVFLRNNRFQQVSLAQNESNNELVSLNSTNNQTENDNMEESNQNSQNNDNTEQSQSSFTTTTTNPATTSSSASISNDKNNNEGNSNNEKDKDSNNEDVKKENSGAIVGSDGEDYYMDAPSTANKNVHLGEKCDISRTCIGNFVVCRNDVCTCEENYVPKNSKPQDCEESFAYVVPLRGSCNRTHRCSGDYVECRDSSCSCRKGYTVSAAERDICRERVQIHLDGPKTDPTMIGVVVGLALMSVTLCIVMRLFAKARFRENRTIFNTANPRLMNVSLKKVKKQISRGNSQVKRGSQDSIQVSDGRQMSVREKERVPATGGGRGFNQETILSTSIDEEPSSIERFSHRAT